MNRTTVDPRRRWTPVVVGLAWLVCLYFGGRLALVTIKSQRLPYDFAQEWTSARSWFAGEPVYAPLSEQFERHLPYAKAGVIHYNAHPPVSVLAAAPFAVLPYNYAYLAWNAVSLLAIGVAFRWTVGREGLRFGPAETAVAAALLVSGASLEDQTLQGQWNGLLLLLIVGAWQADRRGRTVLSGALLGFAAALKLIPAFLLAYHLARRRFSAVAAGVLTFLLANAVGVTLLGWDAYVTYVTVVTREVAKFRDTWPNASLPGLWAKLFEGQYGNVRPIWESAATSRALTVLSMAALAGHFLYIAARNRSVACDDRAWASGVTAMLLASPITWSHYFVLLVPTLCVVWRDAAHPAARGFVLTAAVLLVWLRPSQFWIWTVPGYATQGETAALAGPLVVLTWISYACYLLLALYLLAARRANERSPSPTSP